MSDTLEFFIPGMPAPGGSKTAFVPRRKDGSLVMRKGTNSPVVNVTDAGGKANKEWRKVCAGYARRFMMGSPPFPCALKVEFIFFLRRPNDHFVGGNRERWTLKADAPAYHIGPPDALKYARSTEDALTRIVWNDDSQNIRICSEKRYAGKEDQTGCIVRLVLFPTLKAQSAQQTLPI
jgi:Holliday junction resolvase RusA-like endonuclease